MIGPSPKGRPAVFYHLKQTALLLLHFLCCPGWMRSSSQLLCPRDTCQRQRNPVVLIKKQSLKKKRKALGDAFPILTQVHLFIYFIQNMYHGMGCCSSIPAIPEFHKKLSLLSFWTKCCSPAGVYHSSADRVIKQLEASFARTVNRDYPGLADPGTGQQEQGKHFCRLF